MFPIEHDMSSIHPFFAWLCKRIWIYCYQYPIEIGMDPILRLDPKLQFLKCFPKASDKTSQKSDS